MGNATIVAIAPHTHTPNQSKQRHRYVREADISAVVEIHDDTRYINLSISLDPMNEPTTEPANHETK